jgi:hypothetical protein
MKKHLCSSVLTVIFAALFSMPMATAIAKQQCSASVPSGAPGYWSWRMIDERKCWYEGKPMLSKSLLEWPARPAVNPNPDKEEVASAVTEKPGNPMDAQAREIDTDSRTRAIETGTFDALWRARVGR